MKTIQKACSTILVCMALLCSLTSFANHKGRGGDDAEKTKNYTKTYDVSSSDKISIENSFGETRLETWGSSQVKVDVEIKVEATSDEKAQRMLDNITIEDGKGGDGVYFKTVIENNSEKNRGHNEMQINYVVHLPANNPLDLKTQFGKTIVPDYSGPAEIDHKFGDLIAGNLPNIAKLNVQFGSAKVESIANCKFTIGYSSFTIKKFSGDIDAKIDYCDGGKVNVDNGIKSLRLYDNYSSIKINFAKDLPLSFDINTHFGDMDNHSDYKIEEEKDKDQWQSPKFDYHYTGTTGNGNVKVDIKSNFGSVTIGDESI